VTLAGYFLARLFPPEVLDKYFLLIVVGVIVISVLPAAIHLWNDNRHEIIGWLKNMLARRSRGDAS
jgi:hypothetical protein